MSVSRIVVIVGFAVSFVILGALEALARRPGSRIPTFGDVCAYVMQYEVGKVPVGRIGVLGFWWWVGWHFFAR